MERHVVSYIVFTVRRLLSRCPQIRNVGSGESLCNGQAELLLSAEDLVGNLLLPHRVFGKVENCCETNGHTGHVAILEASGKGSAHLLRDDEVVEVVEFLALDGASHELVTVEMLPRTETHAQDPQPAHVVDHLLANMAPRRLTLLRLRHEVLVSKRTDRLLQRPMALLVVGAPEGRRQPERLGVGDGAQVARLGREDLGRLVGDGADGQAGILGEDLVAVEVVEGVGGVLAGDLLED